MASFSSTRGAISVGFFFLSLFQSFFLFALMHYCARGDVVEGRKESVFPLFCSSEHGTIMFLPEPREWLLCSNLCRDLSCCFAGAMLKSLDQYEQSESNEIVE